MRKGASQCDSDAATPRTDIQDMHVLHPVCLAIVYDPIHQLFCFGARNQHARSDFKPTATKFRFSKNILHRLFPLQPFHNIFQLPALF